MYVIIGLVFLGGGVIGYLLSQFIRYREVQKQKNEVKKSFYTILNTVSDGDCVFVNRINELVVFGLDRGIYSGHVITINITDRVMSVSHNNKSVLVSDFIRLNFPDDNVIDEIIDVLEDMFGDKIHDIVVVNGVIIDRDFLDKTLKETNPMGDFKNMDQTPSVPMSKPEMTVDDVLDKILKTGVKSLSEEEMDILENRSKDD